MLLLITYDVSTEDAPGKTRLRKVSKCCLNYGQRVQNSVFECLVDASQAKVLKNNLLTIIDETKDSIRFYYLGDRFLGKIEQFGVKQSYDPQGSLII